MKRKSEVVSRTQPQAGNLQSPLKVQATKNLLKSNSTTHGLGGECLNSVVRLWRATWRVEKGEKARSQAGRVKTGARSSSSSRRDAHNTQVHG